MSNSQGGSFFDKLANLFSGAAGKGSAKNRNSLGSRGAGGGVDGVVDEAIDEAEAGVGVDNINCCSNRVHIAYRGVSDDRLYLAENRTSNEVKFFRPLGLRIFCAECRKRLM